MMWWRKWWFLLNSIECDNCGERKRNYYTFEHPMPHEGTTMTYAICTECHDHDYVYQYTYPVRRGQVRVSRCACGSKKEEKVG